MPTTQRLLTDDTGQALVTAVNNIVAAVKPNATEIQMSSSDTTTIATAITNINNKIGTVPSGQTVEDQITTLNSNMATLTYTGTVDSLQTSLVSLASNMSVGEFRNIKYTAGETLAPFRNSRIYGGTFKRTGNNYWSVTLEDPEGVPVYGTYRNGRWSWEPLALESESTTSGTRTEVAQLTTSGTAVSYTVSQTGYYTVLASTASTEGTCTAIIQDTSGNTLLRSTAALARWDNITCGLLPLKAGTTIKAVAIFPSGGSGGIMRIS